MEELPFFDAVAVIAWDGDVEHEVTYVVAKDRVDAFMKKYNEHGRWVVVTTTRTYALPRF